MVISEETEQLNRRQIYNRNNKERISAINRRYQKSHLEVYRINTRRYQARKKVWTELLAIDSDIFVV